MKFSKRPLIVFGIMLFFVLCTEVSNFGNASAQTAQRSASKAGSVDEYGMSVYDWQNLNKNEIINKIGGIYRFQEILPLAQSGNPKAMTLIGMLYESGAGVTESEVASSRTFEGKILDEDLKLKSLVLRGGAWVNAAKAEEWYRKSASQNFTPAMVLLGNLIVLKRGDIDKGWSALETLQNQEVYKEISYKLGQEAFNLFVSAANAGNPIGMYEAASYLEEGKYGIQKDTEGSVRWYRLASNQGFEPAMLKYAQILAEGKIALKNDREAQRLWRSLVAKNGKSSLMAARLLGTYYNIICLRQGNSIRCP